MANLSTNTSNKRKPITTDTKVAIINAVDNPEKSNAQICRLLNIFKHCVYHIKGERQDIERYLPVIRTIHSSSFPIMGITTTLAITTLYKKIKSCRHSRVPLNATCVIDL